MGRPSKFTKAVANEILRRLAAGESLTSICKDDHLPARSTVVEWAAGRSGASESFPGDYVRAREMQAEVYFDQVIDIADETDPENATVAKLRADSRKWVLGRMDRAKYGDSSKLALGGDPDAPPIASATATINVDSLTPEECESLTRLAHKVMQRGAK